MIRAVLDTNVLVSGLIARRPSPPLLIYRAFIDQRFLMITSASILAEAEEVLNRPHLVRIHGWSSRRVSQHIAILAALAVVAPEFQLPEAVCQDPDDDKFIACAISGNADVIVSGD
jgi:putative PIN family toxin of toxin-antitoxin system